MDAALDTDALRARIRDVPDFPKPGILFRDITPLLRDGAALAAVAAAMAEPFRARHPDCVLGIESRGFILGPMVARELGCGFVPVRKRGKLPWKVLAERYALEYGEDHVEMHADAVARGESVLVVDDVVATGGTARAACALVERAGAAVAGLSFLIELAALGGRRLLAGHDVHSVLTY